MHERFPRLAERAEQPAASLSGGEQQLLVIARALMGAPELLCSRTRRPGSARRRSPRSPRRCAGSTALIAEESLALARLVADRIVLVDAGRVVLDAPREEALEDPRLGVGYITGSSSTA